MLLVVVVATEIAIPVRKHGKKDVPEYRSCVKLRQARDLPHLDHYAAAPAGMRKGAEIFRRCNRVRSLQRDCDTSKREICTVGHQELMVEETIKLLV